MVLLMAVLLGGCQPAPVTYIDVPIPSPLPNKPSNVRTGGTRLMSVERLYAFCRGPVMYLQVSAYANTGGWERPWLNRLSVDGAIVTYEVVAVPPPPNAYVSAALQVFDMRHDELRPDGVSRVRVISQSNELTADLRVGC